MCFQKLLKLPSSFRDFGNFSNSRLTYGHLLYWESPIPTLLCMYIMCVLQIEIIGTRAHLQNQFGLPTHVKNKWGILELNKFTIVENDGEMPSTKLLTYLDDHNHAQHSQTCTGCNIEHSLSTKYNGRIKRKWNRKIKNNTLGLSCTKKVMEIPNSLLMRCVLRHELRRCLPKILNPSLNITDFLETLHLVFYGVRGVSLK